MTEMSDLCYLRKSRENLVRHDSGSNFLARTVVKRAVGIRLKYLLVVNMFVQQTVHCRNTVRFLGMWINVETRMHSSRMRTVRSSSHVYLSMHWAGGCLPRQDGGRLPGVVSAQEGVCSRGVSAPGGSAPRGVCIPACTEADPPMNRITYTC